MHTDLPIFMGDVPEYNVVGDHMHIKWRTLEIVLPVSVMLAGMGNARRAIDEWARRDEAEVIPFPGCAHG